MKKGKAPPVCVFVFLPVQNCRQGIPQKEQGKASRRVRHEGMIPKALCYAAGGERADSMRAAAAGTVVTCGLIEGAGKPKLCHDKDAGVL